MDSLTITIGRNIGTEPMDELSWRAFKINIDVHAFNCTPDDRLTFRYEGENTWNGVTEESYKIEVLAEVISPFTVSQYLNRVLPGVAEHWHQDAIAFTFGKSTLVTPNNTPTA